MLEKMCGKESTGGIALGGDPKGNGSGGKTVSRMVKIMCGKGNKGSGGNTGPTGDVYGDDYVITNDTSSWFSRQSWYQEFKTKGVKGWFRWVFIDTQKHEPNCKWRRLTELFTDGFDPI